MQEKIKTLWEGQKNILKDFNSGESFLSDNNTDLFSLNDRRSDLQEYLDSLETAQFGVACIVDISRWYLENGSLHILSNKRFSFDGLNRSALGYYWGAVLGDAVGHAVQGKSPFWGWNNEAGPALGLNIMMGWLDKAEAITHVYHRSFMSNDELLVNKGSSLYRAPWFVYELMVQHLGLELDKSKVEYPSDMWPYDKVLADWKTTDLLQLDKLVFEMAEYHVDQSKHDMSDDDMSEFNDMIFWLLPYEILAFLKLRECIGLENPTEWSHPLMQESVCQLPTGIAEIPEFPLLNEFLAKLEVDHPEIVKGINSN